MKVTGSCARSLTSSVRYQSFVQWKMPLSDYKLLNVNVLIWALTLCAEIFAIR